MVVVTLRKKRRLEGVRHLRRIVIHKGGFSVGVIFEVERVDILLCVDPSDVLGCC